MSAYARQPDADEDEFDSLFDDQSLLDPELEESLAQAEANYSASQAVQQPASHAAAPNASFTFRLEAEPPRPARRIGTFVQPPSKKQRLDPGPSNLSRVAAAYREPEPDQVIVRNFRDEEFADNDDEQWWAGNHALDQVEEEAIRMSQQMPTSQPHQSNADHNQDVARKPQRRGRPSAISEEPPDPITVTDAAHQGHVGADTEELEQLRAEVERLRTAQKAQEETVDKLRQEAYRKSGEVAVVRQNLTKLNQENSKLREREVVREQEHRAALDRLQKDQERRLQRLETETAFRRVEQDTSRRIWPSSVARLPPVGLRDVDRRQESQVRAGLTTPTKANRFGIRGGSGSSGNRQRYAGMDVDREEPGTPTRSAAKPLPQFPRPPTAATSASKAKAFRGLQNSFADFGPVQEKVRQQRESPVKPSAKAKQSSALAPAVWDGDQSQMAAHDHDDDFAMADDHPPPSVRKNAPVPATIHDADKAKEHHYLAAMSEILSRRTTIVSLLLSHASTPAAAPASYPSNRFNPSASSPHARTPNSTEDSAFSTSTLSRLISANLVQGCPDLLLFRYRKAVESLLTSLSSARVLEPEEREDAFRLLSADGSGGAIEELDFSSATMHLSHAIASSLMVMAGVLLRLCQTDLLTDVLRLVSCLVSTLPRFWLDLECLQTDQEARRDEMAFLGIDEEVFNAEWAQYSTPIHVREILAQCVADCRSSGTRARSGSNGVSHDESHQDDDLDMDSPAKEPGGGVGLGSWTLSSEAREDLLHEAVQVLRAMCECPEASLTSSVHPLRLLSRPGVLHKLLHPDRSTFILFNVVRMLSSAVSNAPLIHECLATKSDFREASRSSHHSTAPRANARFPVLELLVKHLVDRRFDMAESEWHHLHRAILTFLTQAALRSADTLIVLADSAALLAALIRCLSLDSDFVWLQSRPTFLLPPRMPTYRRGSSHATPDPSGADLVQATERIVMDVRLLNLLYNYPLPNATGQSHRFEPSSQAQERMGSISLANKLDQPETYSMLNGIRQSFVVALSRIAFCSEPDWIATERKLLVLILPGLRKEGQGEERVREQVEQSVKGLDRVSMLLEAIADVAGDLVDIVLSPEEIDSVYELLVSEEDEEMDVDQEDVPRGEPEKKATEEDMGSETESEPELNVDRGAGGRSARASKSVSPRKGARPSTSPRKSGVEEVDVIEIDDSD
ncbi:hypothetical protein PSEUBRA_004780 [Kalmanozyma brasiliensis GHG001]|uniref:uncharacterized protein n=1 Tax=Kalmanozyma brasiliensis (strain GHG001) TaxID=1365824 RepID=UPI002867FA13|nr:uncharacterized protein PSEUBRA_004780 [Kalmanozyma brasiliensis GHG001]EST05759.2 hypothetical protein PSEUBRA_004780 [Kalmanozyma brasiliensis GHG001]